MKMLVLFYSSYGHTYRMAQAVEEGAARVSGCAVDIRRVPETLHEDVLSAMGAEEAQQTLSKVPFAKVTDLPDYDAIVFGTPTRFGNMAGQMRQFLDRTGTLWMQGALIGKVGSVFVSASTQHGGQESTILSFHTTLLHHGMIIVGLPYSFQGQMLIDEVTGGSPYGAGTVAGAQGERMPSVNELKAAAFQGEHVASIGKKIAG